MFVLENGYGIGCSCPHDLIVVRTFSLIVCLSKLQETDRGHISVTYSNLTFTIQKHNYNHVSFVALQRIDNWSKI